MTRVSIGQSQQFQRTQVFISHRGSDALLAERLANEIRNAGYDVWLDKWEINIGDSIIKQINTGLQNEKYLILCYSASDVLSPWISREWMSALALQLNGYNVKILPVRLSGGDPPAILADIKYADVVVDWNNGIAELLQAMR
jgi:hypothetical protein